MSDDIEQQAPVSRDPEARASVPSTERVLWLRSAATAMATGQVLAFIAVAALATVVVVPNSANAVRVIVTITSITLIAVLSARGGAGWLAVTIPAAILWNPISPVYLPRPTWLVLDFVFGGLLVALILWSGFRRATISRELATVGANRTSI